MIPKLIEATALEFEMRLDKREMTHHVGKNGKKGN